MPQGTIKKLVHDRGFGFISGGDAEVFFHHTSVANDGFDDLQVDQAVEYEVEESDDDMNSLRSSLYGDSDDEDFVPPPPPRDEEVLGEKSDGEESVQDTEDEHSLASESEPMENEQMEL